MASSVRDSAGQERDLHDGAQARLVSLSMRIGLARRAYASDPEAARKLLDDAQDQVEQALTELRHVVRGIHPPILSDRGLAGAVRALAASSGLGVTVQVDGLEDGPRAPAAVEAAAYFVVAEALTNAAKHSGAGRAEVQLTCTGTGLRVLVRDEGRGGADSARTDAAGSGLPGMRRRVAALGNTAIADTLIITERAVSKHIGNVFAKLGLPQSDSGGHRRVGRAVPIETRRQRVDAEAGRLAGLGALLVGTLNTEGLDHYAVAMKDPEGNEFDIN
jgi:glucose-6-phosphate-specific signal transduction histidine kinase